MIHKNVILPKHNCCINLELRDKIGKIAEAFFNPVFPSTFPVTYTIKVIMPQKNHIFTYQSKIIKFWVGIALLVGISTTLKSQYISRNFDVGHYTFKIQIFDTKDEIEGEAIIKISAKNDPVTVVTLDLIEKSGEKGMEITSVQESGQSIPFVHKDKLLRVTLTKPVQPGHSKEITVIYKGQPADGLIISKNKFEDRTFFGDNWPNRARYWLPTVDHPSDKATNEFIITAPNHYQVVANGILQEITDIEGNRRITYWREDTPIPTKVMVFGAARFAVQHRTTKSGKSLQSWLYPQDREKGFYDYAMAERILDFFEQHLGEYPYQKLANVQSKTKFGGMENANVIFYNETALDGKRSNETLLAHEIAHQWFGNCISEKDWHHIWLSEGFATYFTNVYLEFVYGRDKMVTHMAKEKQQVFQYDEKFPMAIIIDSLTKDLNRLLNVNTYQKASWILHMLRYEVGEENFWNIIHDYINRHKNSNATTEDFQKIAETISQKSLKKFFHRWLKKPGFPLLQCTWSYEMKTKTVKLTVKQNQQTPFEFTMDIGIQYPKQKLEKRQIIISESGQTFSFSAEQKPVSIVIDPDAWLLSKISIEEK